MYKRSNSTSFSLDSQDLCKVPNEVYENDPERLWLSNNALSYLPVKFRNLEGLRQLWLNNNKFTRVSNLPPYLKTLCIIHNPLRDVILDHCVELREVSICECELEALPDMRGLVRLYKLEAHANLITYIPTWINELVSLEHLSLHSNKIGAIPEALGKLSRLKWLSLHYNNLTILPDSMGDLQSLERMSLHANKLEVLPDAMGKLSKLQVLSLFHNKISVVPETWCAGMKSMIKLALHDNAIVSLPEGIRGMSALEEIWVYDNPLMGSVGALSALCDMPSLKTIHLGAEKSVVPEVLKNKVSVRAFALKPSNRACGEICWKIFMPYAFKRLNISDETPVNAEFVNGLECVARNVDIWEFVKLLDAGERACLDMLDDVPETCDVYKTRIPLDLKGKDVHNEEWIFVILGQWLMPIKRISEFTDPLRVLDRIARLQGY